MDAAIWGAEPTESEGTERIYVVEPTGDYEDDPNLTDKKFPGNPTKSYRSKQPLRQVRKQRGTADQRTPTAHCKNPRQNDLPCDVPL